MTDENAFLQTILNSPNDVLPRLVFADWLEERGDPRGELLRLLHVLTQSIEVPGRDQLEDRLRRLLEMGVKPVGPFVTNSLGMKFALIPPGTFLMGSPEDEEYRDEGETQHKVTLTRSFLMGIYPVTQNRWQQIMGNNPSDFKGDELPVENVSWDDCQEFLRNLSKREGHLYRLPTEAEWEYSCRAGTTTPFSFGKTITAEQVNFDSGVPGKATPVGSFQPNAWGLFDMHGNAWEWCEDWYGEYPTGEIVNPQGPKDGTYRVWRGGGYYGPDYDERCAYRFYQVPTYRCYGVGFRVVRAI